MVYNISTTKVDIERRMTMETKALIELKNNTISSNLEKISQEIAKEIETINNLAVSEETLQGAKKARTRVSKIIADFEEQRKRVKSEIIKPYDDFVETVYNPLINDLKVSEKDLGTKVNNIETLQKERRREQIKAFYEEHAKAYGVDFVPFEKLNINITKSASEKSLKNQCVAYVEKFMEDVETIKKLPSDEQAEILAEYKTKLNLSQVLNEYYERKKRIEQEKLNLEKSQEQAKRQKELTKRVEVSVPVIKREEKKVMASFSVVTTTDKLKKLVDFLKMEGITYEQF